jgi:hypothetical protein
VAGEVKGGSKVILGPTNSAHRDDPPGPYDADQWQLFVVDASTIPIFVARVGDGRDDADPGRR